MTTVLYHHRGDIGELVKLNDWWKKVGCSAELWVKLDEDDENLPHIIDHFEAGAFHPCFNALIGERVDDAYDMTVGFHIACGKKAARELVLVTSDSTRIAIFLLAYNQKHGEHVQ